MNKKSNQIENELNQTTKRLDELTEMRTGITTNLQTLQKGFIDGKTSLDALQAEQSKLTTLESSIKALEAKQDELHTAFQKASASETRQALLEKAKVTATEAEAFHHEFTEIRNKFNDSVRDYAEKTVEKMSAWRGKQRDFGRIANETGLTFQELEQLGLTAESYKAATAEYINPTPLEYGAALSAAVSVLTAKLDRAAQAKDKAEFNEQRAANQEKIKAQIEAENNKPKPFVVTYAQQ
jgi:DNA repair exonuclease SbcCD ATPase subunit